MNKDVKDSKGRESVSHQTCKCVPRTHDSPRERLVTRANGEDGSGWVREKKS